MRPRKVAVVAGVLAAVLVVLAVAPWWLMLSGVALVAGFIGGVAARPTLEARWGRRFNRPEVEAPPVDRPAWVDPFSQWGKP